MLALEALHGVDVEEATRPHLVGSEEVLQRRAKVAAEPVSERDHETLLPVGEHLLGQDPGEGGFQEPLQATTGHLDPRGQAQALLDDPVVAERGADLEGVVHAHPIGHREEIVGKISGEIEAKRAVHGVAVSARGERLLLGRVHAGLEMSRQRRAGESHQLRVAEEARPADVSIAQGGVGVIGEAPSPVAPVSAGRRVGQPPGQRARRVAEPAREPPVELRHAEAEIAWITAEGLVAADPRQRDLDVTRRRLGHDVRRDRGGVGERLVERPDDRREHRLHVGLEDLLVVIGLEALRDEPGVRQLVVRGRSAAEAYREGRDPARRHLAHAGDHGARVDAAREEDAERHVAFEASPHRLAQSLSHRRGVFRGPGPRSRRRNVQGELPVAAERQAPVDEHRRVGRRELVDRVENRARGGCVAEREVVMERRPVEPPGDRRMTKKRLGLRGEEEQVPTMPVVERLLSQPVTSEEQPPLGAVPDGEGEHAGEALDARFAVRGVGVEDDLGVAPRPEPTTAGLQHGPQLAEVVDLAVEDDPVASRGVAHGLLARHEIDDRQTRHPEADVGRGVDSRVVRPAVLEEPEHRGHELARRRADMAGDAAHLVFRPRTHVETSPEAEATGGCGRGRGPRRITRGPRARRAGRPGRARTSAPA